jgi:acetylornithine deacetylase/succinyl-diaminopimelate desuccinylase-like protein
VTSPDELDSFIASKRERFVEELRDLCAIPCEASDRNALDAAARWCRDRLRAAGVADARELRADGPALVVGVLEAGNAR